MFKALGVKSRFDEETHECAGERFELAGISSTVAKFGFYRGSHVQP